MSFPLSQASKTHLETCDPRLQQVVHELLKVMDVSVITGFRDKAAQDKAVRDGLSKLPWPKGKHNKNPSLAVDLAPYLHGKLKGIQWGEITQFAFMAGTVMEIGRRLKIPLRWGGDWNRNQEINDETFRDWGHFEIDE